MTKKLIAFALCLFFVFSGALAENADVAECRALALALQEKTKAAAAENTADIGENVYLRICEIAGRLKTDLPADAVFVDMDKVESVLRTQAENALADMLTNAENVSSKVIGLLPEEKVQQAAEAAEAMKEKAESIFGNFSDGLSDFSDIVFENVTEEDLEELQALGEAFAGKAFDIFKDVFEGAGEYAEKLIEKLPDDVQSEVEAFLSEAGKTLEDMLDGEELAFVSAALTEMKISADGEAFKASGYYIFDTGEEYVPAVYAHIKKDGSVALSAMYLDRTTIGMLIGLEAYLTE